MKGKGKILTMVLAALMTATIFASVLAANSDGQSTGYKPDMVVKDIWVTKHLSKWRVHADVKNIGPVYAGAQWTYFYKDYKESGEECLGNWYHALGFRPGITKYPYTPKFSMSGTQEINVIADFFDQVDESDETNNMRTEYITFS
ncbi:MAG: CARDB domain-containing protein [Candidatus Thermoplasmatota archaeon]|nr:CARDB domain-containing protein [Candidatus Thermoplasmatota archaeon]